jgi:Rrf2 family nitric oxide-sensitive transcriptional repressor
MRLEVDPRKLRLGEVVRRLEADFALVECFGSDNRCVLTGGCGLERALQLALAAFFAELDRYTLADLANASPALVALPMWQPVSWPAPMAAAPAPRSRRRNTAG